MTEMAFWVLLGVAWGWFITMSSGVVFAYIVFRCKREPHESMFQLGKPKGGAFVVDDFVDNPPVKGRVHEEEDVSKTILDEMTNKFLQQQAMEKALVKEGKP